MDDVAVGLMLAFQRSGTGFDGVWDRIGPCIEGMVRGRLRKRLVLGPRGSDDQDAVAETVQQISVELLELPGKPANFFVPPPGSPAVDALRGWLFGFCRTNVDKYCSKWRGVGRKRKVLTESALTFSDQAMNSMDGQTEFSSIVKLAPAKIEVDRRELEQIVNECVAALPDDELRTLIRLNIWEGLSVRALDELLGIHESTIQRRLQKARNLLREALEDRGVDASWLGGRAGEAPGTGRRRASLESPDQHGLTRSVRESPVECPVRLNPSGNLNPSRTPSNSTRHPRGRS